VYLVQAAPDTVKVPVQQSGMLPLHFACLDPIASTDVIHFLVKSYTKAVKVKDKKGRLPLHLACMQGQETTGTSAAVKTIECLVHAWPASVRVGLRNDAGVNHDDDFISHPADMRRIRRFQREQEMRRRDVSEYYRYCDRNINFFQASKQ